MGWTIRVSGKGCGDCEVGGGRKELVKLKKYVLLLVVEEDNERTKGRVYRKKLV